VSFQVWQVKGGSLVQNTPRLELDFIDSFPKLSEARAFLSSDIFIRTYLKDRNLGEFVIIPEGQMFVVMPSRLESLISVSDVTE
jgi:hypothetical protein